MTYFRGGKRLIGFIILSAFFVVSFYVYSCKSEPKEEEKKMGASTEGKIRYPSVAGTFYPGEESALKSMLVTFLQNVVPSSDVSGEIIALISPHAGYVYSGQVAAYAYALVAGKSYDVVVVVAPSHRAYFRGVSIYSVGDYETPLGRIPVHRELGNGMIDKYDFINYVEAAHSQEHSLEVQLPFLQVQLAQFKLLPIVMGSQDFRTCKDLSKAIAEAVKGKKTLLIASSDLSHFHSYDAAVKLDSRVCEAVEQYNPQILSEYLAAGKCEACGGGPMVTVMLTAKSLGANKAVVLNYANSGDVTGDKNRVVGYMSAVFFKSSKSEEDGFDVGLTEEDKTFLKKTVYEVIEAKIKGKEIPIREVSSHVLNEPRGAFVTLTKKGHLRGCVGYIKAIKPLYQTIREMAVAAAFSDYRFRPLKAEEFPDIEVEISVLSPLMLISDVDEIQVGKHGIYIEKGYNSGLLLPQVATKYGWDRMEFVRQTCYKAGLSSDAWQDKSTKIHIFSADIF